VPSLRVLKADGSKGTADMFESGHRAQDTETVEDRRTAAAD